MKVTGIYFSPTGNSKKYVQTMARAICPDPSFIDLTTPDGWSAASFGPEELVIFGAPVYAGTIPAVTGQRLAAFRGSNTPCILLASYGNRHYDDALAHMEDIVKTHGFVVKGGAACIGRHTYGQIQTHRPDAADLQQAADFARRAAENTPCAMPGDHTPKPPFSGKFHPLTADTCIHCGLCAGNCPVGAIGEDHIAVTDACISCFRCIRNCPTGAKNMDTEAYLAFAQSFSEKLATRRENEYFL